MRGGDARHCVSQRVAVGSLVGASDELELVLGGGQLVLGRLARRSRLSIVRVRGHEASRGQASDRHRDHLARLPADGEPLAELPEGERATVEFAEVGAVVRLEAVRVRPLRSCALELGPSRGPTPARPGDNRSIVRGG